MKDDINLMPPAAKKERVRKVLLRNTLRVYNAAVSGLLLITLALGAVIAIQQVVKKELSSSVREEDQEQAGIEMRVKEVNQLTAIVTRRLDEQENWTERIHGILSVMPNTMRITAIRAQQKPALLQLEGESESRSSVVDFERLLENLDWVSSVDAPLQNLAGTEIITFTITLHP